MPLADFALNLECIEAQFYVCATTGLPLPANLTGNDLQPIGCQKANFTNPDLVLIAAEIAMVRSLPPDALTVHPPLTAGFVRLNDTHAMAIHLSSQLCHDLHRCTQALSYSKLKQHGTQPVVIACNQEHCKQAAT